MQMKKVISLGLTLVMLTTGVGCGATGASTAAPAGGASSETAEAAPAEAGGETAAETADGAGAEAADGAEAAAGAAGEEIAASDISVKWEDSHIYNKLTLGYYKPITTYEVKGYEDVPFLKVSEYLDYITEGRAKCSMDNGVMTITHNKTNVVVDSLADTVQFENPARFRSNSIVDGSIVEEAEFNVIRWSTKNQSTQTDMQPVTIAMRNYHMPVIAYEDDVLMPFLALQNSFVAVQFSSTYQLAYNGKDYYNIYEANMFALGHDPVKTKETPYIKAIYSGPFSELKETTQAYADYGYYSVCLMLDLCFGHKEEKNITTFDEYFTRMNAKKAMTSTDPSAALTAEILLFNYLFDSSHDSMLNVDNVFNVQDFMNPQNVGAVVSDVKDSEVGKEVIDNAQKLPEKNEEDISEALLGMLTEAGIKIPQTAPQMIWGVYMATLKPKEKGDTFVEYSGDTAVITFYSFEDSSTVREPSFYLDPIKEEDVAKSNFAFFYKCFEDIKTHEEVKNVVVNLSGNGGGAAAGLVSILGFMSKDGEVRITDLDTLTGSYREEYYHIDTNVDGIADDQDGFGDQYDFYIMTSGESYSCGTALPYFAQKNGFAKIIGSNPGGGDCCVGNFVDAYGRCAAFSGMLKLGMMEDGEFVSDETAVKLDYNMMPSIMDVTIVPWFDTDGIAEAVHNYQNGETTAVYSDEDKQNAISDFLMKLFESIAAQNGADLSATEGATAEAAAVE